MYAPFFLFHVTVGADQFAHCELIPERRVCWWPLSTERGCTEDGRPATVEWSLGRLVFRLDVMEVQGPKAPVVPAPRTAATTQGYESGLTLP